MPTPRRWQSLIPLIYEAALDPGRWSDFLSALAEAIGGCSTQLLYHDLRGGRGRITTSVRLDPEARRRYDEHFAAIDPWLLSAKASRALTPGIVHLGEELVSRGEFVRTEYYADLAGPFGISRTIAAVIRLDETTVSSISSMRPDSSEPFGRGERRVLRALMPHLQQALRIHRRVVSAEIGRATAVEALDAMPLGVIVLRTDASVVFANGAAQEILNARDGLESVDGRLQASAPAEDRRLRDLVGSAAMTAAGDGEQPGGTIVLPRPSMRLPLSVLVTPLRTVASTGLSEAHAAVFVADPERGVRVQSEVLQHLWGLTPAEASIASRIAIGQSVSDIAETLTLGEGTVRWHVKNVLSKTQTARQADLVRVITTGPSVVRRTGK